MAKSFCLQHHFALMELLQRMTSPLRKLNQSTDPAERETWDQIEGDLPKNCHLENSRKSLVYFVNYVVDIRQD